MKLKLTIAKKLGLGFGVLTLAVLFNTILTYNTLEKSRKTSDEVIKIYSPSVSKLADLYSLVSDSKMLIKTWVYIDKMSNDTPGKIKLRKIHRKDFPELRQKLNILSEKWTEEQREKLKIIYKTVNDTLFEEHKDIMSQLMSFEDYEDTMVQFELNTRVDPGSQIMILTEKVLENISFLKKQNSEKVEEAMKNMELSFNDFQNLVFIMGFVLVIGAIITALFTTNSLVRPINYVKEIIFNMSKGILPEESITEGDDEIGEMSHALNLLVDGLKDTSKFSLEIGNGDFETKFKPLSEKDTLGNSLLIARKNLKKAKKDDENRKKEDSQRNWTTQGLAKFSDILRHNNDSIKKLSDNLISNLVKYLGANQGGIFIMNEENKEDKFIELMSCYAYERHRYVQKRIDIGIGLIGRCVKENETIYMTDIPKDYINIISGLGESPPTSLLLIPLNVNEETFGVMEFASFSEFPPYQIDFLEKVGENIASTISSVKINLQTSKLLRESQKQSERLAQQEEEVRQNMEEMQATQEETSRREVKTSGILKAINNVIIKAELNTEAKFISINEEYTKATKYRIKDLKNKKIFEFLPKNELENFKNIWNNVLNGKSYSNIIEKRTRIGGLIYLFVNFSPIEDKNTGEIIKVLLLANNLTKYREISKI